MTSVRHLVPTSLNEDPATVPEPPELSPKPHILSSTLTEDSATSQAVSPEIPLHPSEEPAPLSENSHQVISTLVREAAPETEIQIASPAAGAGGDRN